MELTARDKALLKGVHPDLVKAVLRAAEITPIPFRILEGVRTVARQKELVAKGASKTMNSRHLTGHAVDIAPLANGKVTWDWPVYHKLAPVIKKAFADVGVPREWGGDWKNFKDGPHWQLPWAQYPVSTSRIASLPPEVTGAAPYTNETETGAAVKSAGVGAAGAAGAGAIAAGPIVTATEVLTSQQGELTSGDWVRMAVAGVILVLALWGAYKLAKG